MKSQRIVILGGTGFVGNTLVPRLSADGHQLLLLSRNREGRRHSAVGRNVTVATADIYDPPTLRKHIAGADAVIHLVGILNESGKNTFERVFVDLTRLVVEACRDTGGHPPRPGRGRSSREGLDAGLDDLRTQYHLRSQRWPGQPLRRIAAHRTHRAAASP